MKCDIAAISTSYRMARVTRERTYSQIDLDAHRKIERWRHAGVAVDVIAEKLGRRSSASPEQVEDREMPDLDGTAHIVLILRPYRLSVGFRPYRQ
ncbi:MAG: hypothetical protein EOR78_27605 [Mesorhizobium sp.]|nr:MAG: hypothetical protein EOR49_22480 [Mesorhizobium sp.]RWM49423.1 MAG: hypothetical protein EOR78_27605 [Mesorhizobium sp.]RWM53731.1 MAG: hypothetical protein EOR76_00485 [Mesorhizobium sp.]RWM54003.1 MAG: hypothetical protein EOR79_24880 [Mesorhizobium sp.]RWM93882.1 MAG: hypothetical protein EOR85_26425 [Mesorhizobium sp.]